MLCVCVYEQRRFCFSHWMAAAMLAVCLAMLNSALYCCGTWPDAGARRPGLQGPQSSTRCPVAAMLCLSSSSKSPSMVVGRRATWSTLQPRPPVRCHSLTRCWVGQFCVCVVAAPKQLHLSTPQHHLNAPQHHHNVPQHTPWYPGMARHRTGRNGGDPPSRSVMVGKLNLVDLAGSERVHLTGAIGRDQTAHLRVPRHYLVINSALHTTRCHVGRPPQRGCSIPQPNPPPRAATGGEQEDQPIAQRPWQRDCHPHRGAQSGAWAHPLPGQQAHPGA